MDSAVGQDSGTGLDASPGADAEVGPLDSSVGPDVSLDAGSNQDAVSVLDSNVAPDTSGDAGAGTVIDFTTITGTNASTFGVAGTLRALEFI